MVRKLTTIFMAVLPAAVLLLAQTAPTSAPAPNTDKQGIIKTALDYGEGFYTGDAARMERSLHPDLNKVAPFLFIRTGKIVLNYSSFSEMVENCRIEIGRPDESERKLKVTVLEVKDDMACVKLTSALFDDYLNMVNFDGQWKIVNVLWTYGPDSMNRMAPPEFDLEKERDVIKATARDYYEGRFGGDVARLEKAVHPEVRPAQVFRIPQTGKTIILRTGPGQLAEMTQDKQGLPPDDQRKYEVRVLDVMDGLAFVAGDAPSSTSYFQLAFFDDQWKVVNILFKAWRLRPNR